MENLSLFWERLLADKELAWFVGILALAFVLLLLAFLKVVFTADKSEKLAYQRWRNGLWAEDYLEQLKKTTEGTQRIIEALRTEISEREEESRQRLEHAQALEAQITQRQAALAELKTQNRQPFQLSAFFIGFGVALVLCGLTFGILIFMKIVAFV